MHTYSYLALGDSYTIGEGVLLHQSFPYRAVQQLRGKGHHFLAPEVIARTGWTAGELDEAMRNYLFLPKYDFVSLLIGVNNQYRGQEVIGYKLELEELLKKAIALANGKKEHVLVVSIPDYSVTPHAISMAAEKIAKEIDVFNSVNKALSIQYKVQFVDIAPESRMARENASLLSSDGLHPSAKAYEQWAAAIAAIIAEQIK